MLKLIKKGITMNKKGRGKLPVGEDCRFKRSESTKERLSDTLKKLIRHMDYNAIGVSRIARESGMSRNSFYYHFASKEELVDYILERDLRKGTEKAYGNLIGWDSLVILCRTLYADHYFYKAISASSDSRKIQAIISPLITKATGSIFHIPEKSSCSTLAVDSVMTAIIRWMEADNPRKPYDFLYNLRNEYLALAEGFMMQPGSPVL